MRKIAVILDSNSIHGRIIFAVDLENASEILPYLFKENVEEEFRQIRDIIKQQLRIKDKYCKCDVSEQANNMFEMRFTRNGKNDRIYCQEIHKSGIRYIVLCELYENKKTQAIPKKIKNRIEILGGHFYEFK